MVYKIQTPEHAEIILMGIANANPVKSFIIFDISESVQLSHSVPLVLRACDRCENPSRYLGWNIWGKDFDKPSTYCEHCGYAMKTVAQVDLAIQGSKVINTSWRS